MNLANDLAHLSIAGEEIITTKGHPFYVVDYGWKDACELQPNDKVVMYDDTIVTVNSIEIEHLDQETKVYNFEVENAHTYYVTDKGILVHNLCAGTSSNNSTNLQFDSLDNLNNHYRVHGKEFGDLVKNTDDYIDLANYVIKNGEYIPEMNGYIRFLVRMAELIMRL